MKPTRILFPVVVLLAICVAPILPGCSGASISGIATIDEPDWYKISIQSQETLDLQVNACNVTGNTTLIVALALGIEPEYWNTAAVTATHINSTKNATISYKHVDSTPLYLTIAFITNEESTEAIVYDISSTHPIVTYSYQQYYDEVVYPEIVLKTTIVGVLIGSVAMILTVYFLKRRQKERSALL